MDARLAQAVERPTSVPVVAGSIPAPGSYFIPKKNPTTMAPTVGLEQVQGGVSLRSEVGEGVERGGYACFPEYIVGRV